VLIQVKCPNVRTTRYATEELFNKLGFESQAYFMERSVITPFLPDIPNPNDPNLPPVPFPSQNTDPLMYGGGHMSCKVRDPNLDPNPNPNLDPNPNPNLDPNPYPYPRTWPASDSSGSTVASGTAPTSLPRTFTKKHSGWHRKGVPERSLSCH
jgi:hypothetical protein